MQILRQDVRHAVRVLAKSPGFTIVAVATLALGIGANTAIFSVVNAVLLRPLAYRDSASLVNIWGRLDKDGIPQLAISEPEYWDLLDHNEPFSEIAVYALGGSANLARDGARPAQVSKARATASLFRLLGTAPPIGRTFSMDEDQPGRSHVAVISHGLWEREFGSDPEILNKSVRLDEETYSIVGVLPKEFSLDGRHDVWLPLALDRASPDDRGSHYLHLVARLKPEVTAAQASAALERFAADLRRAHPDNYGRPADRNFSLYMVPVKEQLVAGIRPALLVLLGAVAFVLLIACANVANLQLSHASSREKELAIRAALGAGHARLVRQLLTESTILALAGGLVGLGIADWGLAAIHLIVPANTPRMDEIRLEPLVLAFTFCVCVFTGVAFGLAPAWYIARRDLRASLNDAGRSASASEGSRRLRSALVVAELGLAVLLLAGAGLLMRSFSRLIDVSPGFQTQHLLTMQVSLPTKAYAEGPPVQNFFKKLLTTVKTIPGVRSAGAISEMPLTDSYTSGSLFFEHTPLADLQRYRPLQNLPYVEVDQHAVTSEYFEAMAIPLVRGRLLDATDDTGTPLVAVVDENLARRFWPNEDPLGQRVAVDPIPDATPKAPRWRTIVGVVGHVKHYALDMEGREQIYLPHAQPFYGMYVPREMTLAVRTSLDPSSVTNAVRERVASLDEDLAVYNVATMEDLISNSVAQPRLNLSLLAAFAALALVLAAVGVYGVIAFGVSQRTQEFGIRMALGASPAEVLRQVFLEAGRLTTIGLGLGLAASLALTRVMSSLLFETPARDPLALGAAAAILACVAFAACYVPARRATRIDPLVALRIE